VWIPDDVGSFQSTYEHPNYPGQVFGVAGPAPDDVIREIETLVDNGVSHVAIDFEDMTTFDRFLSEVVPSVRLTQRDIRNVEVSA
jgi:hypothetical protein